MEPTQEYMDTGYAPIDEEHREISAQLRQLLSAVNSSDAARARAAAQLAFDQVAAHFAHEERLMDEWKYPKAARHREAHDNFLKDAEQFGAELRDHGLTPKFRRWVLQRLVTWFQFHITANDVDLGIYLREKANRAAAAGFAPTPRP